MSMEPGIVQRVEWTVEPMSFGGVFVGLASAWEYGLRKMVVEVDRLERLRCTRNLDNCSKDWKVAFQHVLKEGNKVADRLTKVVNLKDIGIVVHHSPSLMVATLLQQDR
ncbi:hypothetical protein V6N11_039374 [Hibiscus sabdariffa]|uniref:RNase H type-1 domain-containing protein n=1 Tax=Hibiscus sabdariffa TaxID=183260 RepID=A0ABR2SN17_9ROSI